MDISLLQPTIIIAIFGLIFGILKSSFGVAAVVITPFLAILIPPKLAIAVLGPIALMGDSLTVRAAWRRWDSATVRIAAIPAAIGTFTGAFILAGISTGAVNKLLAVAIWLYVVGQVFMQRRSDGRLNRFFHWLGTPPVGVVLSLGGGLLGSIAHSGGVLLIPHLVARGLEGERFVATVVAIFTVQGLAKVPGYMLSGVLTPTSLAMSLAAAPMVYAGVLLGRRLGGHISPVLFRNVLNGIMVCGGLFLYFK